MNAMNTLKRSTLSLLLGAALVAPAAFLVPAAPALAATTQGAPSQLVLENSTRVLRTLESRRAEFAKDRGALDAFISTPSSANRAWPSIVCDWPADSETVWKLNVSASRIASITAG